MAAKGQALHGKGVMQFDGRKILGQQGRFVRPGQRIAASGQRHARAAMAASSGVSGAAPTLALASHCARGCRFQRAQASGVASNSRAAPSAEDGQG
jgi:hypothetical protein